MRIIKGPGYAPTWKGKPAGMSIAERALWARWKEHNINEDETIYHNVRLCAPHAQEIELDEQCRDIWTKIGSRRIDALIESPIGIKIIEVRINADEAAVGRLLLYKQLWMDCATEPEEPDLVLITNQMGTPEVALAFERGIFVDVI